MAPTVKTIPPSPGLATSGRAAAIIAATAVAATSAFAGGALLTQTVIVPTWRAMNPAVFLADFPICRQSFFDTVPSGIVLFGPTARPAGCPRTR
jgi:hypothetical protein